MYCGSEKSVPKNTETPRIWKVLSVVGIVLALFAVVMSTISLTLLVVLKYEQLSAVTIDATTTSTPADNSLESTRELSYRQPLNTDEENEILVCLL